LQRPGFTHSAHHADHLLHTPDAFVRAPLPGMQHATAIVHAAPAIGAKFLQYTAEFEAGGTIAPLGDQRFVFVLEGELEVSGKSVRTGGFVYLPPHSNQTLHTTTAARALVIEKPYQQLTGIAAPEMIFGHTDDVPSSALAGDDSVQVGTLIPPGPSFDFAVNTMTFQPGASLPMVEVHVMEHGLMMLSGGGIYRLGEHWYPVTEGDFIWMAPYLPQWFGALGKTPARYLIYKDWNR